MKILIISFYCFFASFQATAQIQNNQDTIYWSPCYQLRTEDFQGKPDTTKIDLANSYIRINYNYNIVNGQLQFKVNCFFLKKASWAKYNMAVLMEHEQTHFNIAKLFALKLDQRLKAYKITNTIQQDLTAIYDMTLKELYATSDLFDKIEKENPKTDIPQKKFETEIKNQLPTCKKNEA